MQFLERISHDPGATWYAIGGEYQGAVRRYVVSTPGTRAICRSPELLGVEFNLALHDGMAASLRTAPFRQHVQEHPEERVCVVNFLRGGLNFEIRRALHTAYGFNRHSSAFMSSQRYREDGRWGVKEDMYRKLEIPDDAVLIMGDVVATGVTMANGLRVIADHMRELGSSVRAVVFYTIGCHKAEKVLEELHQRLSAENPDYVGTFLVYLEGKFRLVDSRTPLAIGIPGTDLVRRGALLAPELEQYAAAAPVLERCAIYDAGSRAFDIPTYVDDVVEYWQQVGVLADGGFTLSQALVERLPEPEITGRDEFIAAKRRAWCGVPEAEIQQIWSQREALLRGGGTAAALAKLAAQRGAAMRELGGETKRGG